MMSIKTEEMQESVETETGECEGRPSPLIPPAVETPPSENDEEFFVAPRTHDDSTVRLNTRGVSLLDPRGFLHQQESRNTEDSEHQLKIVDADSRMVKREESSPPDDSREPEDAVENFEPVEFRDIEGSGIGSTTYEADVRPPLLSVEEQKKEGLPDLDHNMNTDLYSYYSMIDGQIKAESPSLTFTPTSAGANQAQKSRTKTDENEKEVGEDEVLLPSLNLNNDLYYYSMIDDNVENEHEPGREDTAEKGENKDKPDEETLKHEEQYHSLLKLSEKNDLYYSMMNPVGDEEEESFLQECEPSDETKQQKDQHAHNEDNYGRKTINHETPTSLSSRRTTTTHHQYNSPSPPPLSITSSHTDLEHPHHSTASHINHNNNNSDLGMYNTMNTGYSTSNIYYSEMLFQPVSYQNYPSEYNHHNHHHLRTPMSPISRPGSNTITTTSLKRPSSSSPSPVTSPSHHNMKKFPKLMTTPNHSPIPTTSNQKTSATTEQQQQQQSSITATNTTTTTVHHPFPINYDHYMTNSRKQRQANNAGNKGKHHQRKSDGEKNSETETTTETLPPLMNESSNSATTSSSTSASTSAAQRTYTYTGEAIPYPANTHFNNQTNNTMYQGNTTCSNNTNTNNDSSSSSRADDYTNVNHQHNSNIMYHPMYASTHSHHLQQFQQAQYQYSQYQPHNRYPHSQNNLASLEATKRLSCKCKKSQCLMLYCDCFQRGSFCNMFCSCLNCFNTQDHAGPDGRRTQARNECLRRNPNAFEQKKKVKAGVNGCACKNSKCLKKYCECYRNNILCTEKCRCRNCMNKGETPKDTGKDSSMQVQDVISNTNVTA